MTRFHALYFCMGAYNADDGVPELDGYDCPFDDSPMIEGRDERALEEKVRAVYAGTFEPSGDDDKFTGDWESCYPNVIVDKKGEIQVELYGIICKDPDFNPEDVEYSWGRENLSQFWDRERYRWFPD